MGAQGRNGGYHLPSSVQGETGQSKLSFFPSLEEAKRDFEKKFWDKTKNRWADRDSFVAHSGKYTLIEVQADDGEEGQEGMAKVSPTQVSHSGPQLET